MTFQSRMSPTFPADMRDGASQTVVWRPLRWMPLTRLWSNFAPASSTTLVLDRGR